jgi:hypothetical protein
MLRRGLSTWQGGPRPSAPHAAPTSSARVAAANSTSPRDTSSTAATPPPSPRAPPRRARPTLSARVAAANSTSPRDTSSTTATFSFKIRKKSTAPGVRSVPSAICCGEPWGLRRGRGRREGARVRGRVGLWAGAAAARRLWR